jgi:hypothetical protein
VRVPFVTRGPGAAVPDDPDAFYRMLPKTPGGPRGLLVHQGEIVREYASRMLPRREVALVLPTGAGKTLVGALLGEWRRRRDGNRVVYACLTKQLADQTFRKLQQYGIEAVKLVGPQREWSGADRTRYASAQAIAVTSYSAIFNTNPALNDANLLILDDSHAAEGYVAKLWSLALSRDDPAYDPIIEALAPALDPLVVTRLRQLDGGQYAKEVYLASAIGISAVAGELGAVLRRASDAGGLPVNARYALQTLQDHVDRALIFVSHRGILIRPFIAPTSTHPAFENPAQRLYMTATPGDGGELESAFGRRRIDRVQVPAGWDKQGIGRRFFIFPENASDLAGDAEAQTEWMSETIGQFGKAVVLTPDNRTQEEFVSTCTPPGMPVFRPSDVEEDLDVFTRAPQGVLAMANRYDGLDLVDEACRLVVEAGLPARGDLQERFLARDLGAIDVLQERIRSRFVQGAGRATRNPSDFAVVAVLGADLATYVARGDVQAALHPEVHAELELGLDNSYGTSQEMRENLQHFLAQDADWKAAEAELIARREHLTQVAPAGAEELSRAAPFEVAAWRQFGRATGSRRSCLPDRRSTPCAEAARRSATRPSGTTSMPLGSPSLRSALAMRHGWPCPGLRSPTRRRQREEQPGLLTWRPPPTSGSLPAPKSRRWTPSTNWPPPRPSRGCRNGAGPPPSNRSSMRSGQDCPRPKADSSRTLW